jgi:hypothetical protein
LVILILIHLLMYDQGVRCEVLKLLCQLAADDPEYQVKSS